MSQHNATLELLSKLKTEMPELWQQAEVVGNWVWLEFNVAPLKSVREKMRELGFHWNHVRRLWQHPCGVSSDRSRHDPRVKYPVIPATALEMKEATASAQPPVRIAKEY